MSVTTARLLDVKGQPLSDNGLVPDVIVDLPSSGATAHVTLGDPGSDLQFQRALEAVTRAEVQLEPSSGEPELMMNLVFARINAATPNPPLAEKYAREALALVPFWHYIRDILLPQIQRAKGK